MTSLHSCRLDSSGIAGIMSCFKYYGGHLGNGKNHDLGTLLLLFPIPRFLLEETPRDLTCFRIHFIYSLSIFLAPFIPFTP
jgi:hypothetical protein